MCIPVHTYTHSSTPTDTTTHGGGLPLVFLSRPPSPSSPGILSRSSPDPLPVLSRSSPGSLLPYCFVCHPTARSRSVTAPMHHLPRGPAAWGLTETALVPPRGLRFHGSPGLPDSDLCLISRAKAPRYTHVSDVTAPRAGDMRSRLA